MMTFWNKLRDPPRDFSVMPFWFWNDQLSEAEIVKQIVAFETHGVYGFIIHPRVGLPHALHWMSDELLHFYTVAIEEARRRDMRVILYDEGMYPSGSSSGQVVAINSAFQTRGLAKIDLVFGQEPVLELGQNLVAVVTCHNGQRIAVIDRPVNSHIRGIHYMGEGPAEEEPPAADLLNPVSVDTFIHCVYDKFAEWFSKDFGKTIVAIFTDEPSPLGRCREKDVWPGTAGIMREANRILGYDFTAHLPALWYDDEPEAEHYRHEYRRAIHCRMEETWYQPLYAWCEKHGIQLTGHPAEGCDIGSLRYFHIPGQDLVWRRVLPDHPSALEGDESTQGKCSSSAMLHLKRQRNSNECCGAYGHELTWEEMNWLADWCFVRGVNFLYPHAFYYSIRGHRRDERPPDVGPHNSWWHRYREYADRCRRLSWLNSESSHVCHTAILGASDHLPWETAKICFEHQRDFNYLEERHLWEEAEVKDDGIHMAGTHYYVLIVEHKPQHKAYRALEALEESGRLIRYQTGMAVLELIKRIDALVPPDVILTPAVSTLRVRHVVKEKQHCYLLFNEGHAPITTQVWLPLLGHRMLFIPRTGQYTYVESDSPMQFGGYELLVLIIED